MAERVERVTNVREAPTGTNSAQTVTNEVTERRVDGAVLAARVIRFLFGILLVLLAFRFVLVLLGANSSNGFANFIYSTSHPFVSPFFGLFGYKLQYGASHFELYTLIAMAVYALIGYGLARLVTIGRPQRTADV